MLVGMWVWGGLNLKKYNILYADPPWKFSSRTKSGNVQHKLEEYYPTMTEKELLDMKTFINKITTSTSVLFMWTTDATLAFAIKLMQEWGYEYKTIAFIWNKKSKSGKQLWNMGMWTMKGSEICLLGTKGHAHKFLKSRKVKQLVEAPRGRHSEKPQEVRNRIVEMFGENAKYLELFAREKVYPFDVWGNEVKSDV